MKTAKPPVSTQVILVLRQPVAKQKSFGGSNLYCLGSNSNSNSNARPLNNATASWSSSVWPRSASPLNAHALQPRPLRRHSTAASTNP